MLPCSINQMFFGHEVGECRSCFWVGGPVLPEAIPKNEGKLKPVAAKKHQCAGWHLSPDS